MTPDEVRTHVWANRYAQQAIDFVTVCVDLQLALDRINALEKALADKLKTAEVIPIKKDGSNETPLRAD